jgi:elongation factor P
VAVIEAGSVRKGNVIEYENDLWMVLDTQQTFVGKKGAYVQIKMKSLGDGHIGTQRFSTSDKVEKAYVESRRMTYLYEDTAGHVFMDPETGEQVTIDRDMLEDVLPYLAYNAEVQVEFHGDRAVTVELPPSVVLEVTDTEPAVRGNTATSVTKPAEVETGLTVKVPGHVSEGDKIEVDTRNGEFLGRA